MKCAIFFAILAFTSATPLMGWRNVDTYGPQDQDENDHAQVIQTRESIQQSKLYPHIWTEVPEQYRISQMLMNSRDSHEFPQTYQHVYQMPMRTHETPLELTDDYFHRFSRMPMNRYEIAVENTYQHMPMNTREAQMQNHYSGMHHRRQQQFLHQQNDAAQHQYDTVEVNPNDYHHTNQGLPTQYLYSRLQNFVEEHSEQEVQSLIVRLHHWTQELHHRQEEIDQQLSHVESRLRMLRHHQGHHEAYRKLQHAHHQLQWQRAQLVRQQLDQESVLEYLREALVHRQQLNFGNQDDVKQEVARPFLRSVRWY